jgi:drug/metabolite transporter (DMT)-like permease
MVWSFLGLAISGSDRRTKASPKSRHFDFGLIHRPGARTVIVENGAERPMLNAMLRWIKALAPLVLMLLAMSLVFIEIGELPSVRAAAINVLGLVLAVAWAFVVLRGRPHT